MFNPSRDEVREMFFGTWRKYRAGEPLAGIETIALQVILLHPEHHAILDHPERYRDRDYVDESNPFLHMSLHLALECLAETMWRAQRERAAPDAAAYLACLAARALRR